MKKFVSTLLVFALMFVFSTSAFAAKGVADTMETAIDLPAGTDYSLFIQDSNDKDWYKWTNNLGHYEMIYLILNGGSDNEDFRFGFVIKYKNGDKSDMLYADHTQYLHFITNILVPPEATIYFVVKKNSDGPAGYKISRNK
ncbi:hypothetical protein [Paenibacillus alvei]|uniref:Uncharacterized protein n=1 Tax=Paenibacillus alvei TaxID=44250 RepID=A0A383RB81_PAEAL|nr:hypothetical protein [Paenibacillus alvei]SYX84417.1 conserved exported protein of unknown function [Paenibacillus alvei]